jgi:transposase
MSVAKGFRPAERDQQFLLPVDMRDWLPDDHVVWLVLEVVEQLDLRSLEARYALGGVGRQAYDPRMLLALLIYAYSDGVRSSRQIERLCRTDVAMRVICGMQVPDHTVFARFRQRHQDSVRDLFTQVLWVCAKAGLGRLGTIAIDGTKIAANAAKKATCRRRWLQQQVDEIIAQAAEQDSADDAAVGSHEPTGESPQRLWGRRDRAARLKRALAEVIAEETQRGLDAESTAAKQDAFIEATRAGRNDVGSRPVGADPVAIAEARLQAARDRLAAQIAVKRDQIAAMRERIRRFEAGEGPKPNLGPFSFDETRGREVTRAKRWVARAERELDAARKRKTDPDPAATELTPVPGGGRHGPRGVKVKEERPGAAQRHRPGQPADAGPQWGHHSGLQRPTCGQRRWAGLEFGASPGRQRSAAVAADERGRGHRSTRRPPGTMPRSMPIAGRMLHRRLSRRRRRRQPPPRLRAPGLPLLHRLGRHAAVRRRLLDPGQPHRPGPGPAHRARQEPRLAPARPGSGPATGRRRPRRSHDPPPGHRGGRRCLQETVRHRRTGQRSPQGPAPTCAASPAAG